MKAVQHIQYHAKYKNVCARMRERKSEGKETSVCDVK
jgi:hypothetical protein